MTELNTDSNHHPPAGGSNTTYWGEIVNIQSENTILCEKVSISGRKSNFGPRWTDNIWSEGVVLI